MSETGERPTIINDFGRTSFVMHTTGLIEKMEKCTMTEQQEKIFAVLDMSEDEQRSWCWFNIESVHDRYYRKQDISLAGLAFRLRDEVKGSIGHRYWDNGKRCVGEYVTRAPGGLAYNQWFVDYAKPIHWILAALIAKTKESK